jgi:hypothetical protein
MALALSILPILISLIAIWLAWDAKRYARVQVDLMREQEQKRDQERATDDEWAVKCDAAVTAIQKIMPHWMQASSGLTNAYGLAFANQALRARIERYLTVERIGPGPVRARQIGVDQLRLPVVRETITQVLDGLAKFKQNYPDESRKLGL